MPQEVPKESSLIIKWWFWRKEQKVSFLLPTSKKPLKPIFPSCVCNLTFLSAAKQSPRFKLNELRQRRRKSCYF